MRLIVVLALGAVAGAAVAGWQATSLVVNGKKVPGKVIVQGQETYVPVSALKAGGFKVTRTGSQLAISAEGDEPGQMQVDALEAKIGEWLNNGAFRMRVTKVDPISDLGGAMKGFKVTFELRNVSSVDMLPTDAGMQPAPAFYDSNENPLTFEGAAWNNLILFKNLAPAAGTTAEINFWYPVNFDEAKMGKPDRILVQMKPDPDLLRRRKLKITVKQPSMRFLLK